jgi:hypothetical protein
MDKKEIVTKIIEVVKPHLEELGFSLKRSNCFEKKKNGSLYIYEIDVAKTSSCYSLHLKLRLQNKGIADGVNSVLKNVLTDPRMKYPNNFTAKTIAEILKARTSNKDVYGLTDWRFFKHEEQSLEDFNNQFSIWFSVFENIEDKENWEFQLIESVGYAQKWFDLVDNDAYLIEHTDNVAMVLLKRRNDAYRLKNKYEEIYNREKSQNRDTTELKLFYEHLLLEH